MPYTKSILFANNIPSISLHHFFLLSSLVLNSPKEHKILSNQFKAILQSSTEMQVKAKSSSVQKKTSNALYKDHNQQEKPANPKLGSHSKTRVTLGICAMKKKVQSKPMKEILSRIQCQQIEIVEMWSYLESHWSSWPKVDALICFYSEGFPFLMAWKYVKKYNPFLINNLEKQQLLWDRTVVYDILRKIKVPTAKHYFVQLEEDYVEEMEGKRFGNVIPDPLELQVSQLKNLKVHSVQTKSETSAKRLKNKHKTSYCEAITQENSQKVEIPHDFIYKYKLSSNRKESADIDIKKQKQSPIQYDFEETNKHRPTLLRRFTQNRTHRLKKYQIEEAEDFIIIKNGDKTQKLKKPFVEKPFDAENHQICVYYPSSMGGGRKKLFRKVKDQSSLYENVNEIRRDGNFIYEEFLQTNAFDIKVYTVGPYYMYAEARRSPTLDGVVLRNTQGKEMRYPVILTPAQKFICNRIVQQFGQEVCGFDLLRSNGRSYVCDVNGWSFVKSSAKYWQDCAYILKKKIMNKFFPERQNGLDILQRFKMDNGYRPPLVYLKAKVEELRSIVSIFRHGDRSPKLKLKIKTKDQRFAEFFVGQRKDQLKFRDTENLNKILAITISIIAELEQKDPSLKDYLQMKIILESRRDFDELNAKFQMKALERYPSQQPDEQGKVKTIQIIMKWGGQLSHAGYLDAIKLGQKMRMQRYDDNDCLSLYSSYRHDVKTYASDQGRCIKTAAAFLKGFLSIQGELAPIISSMVKADFKAQRTTRRHLGLLDCTSSQNHSLLADQIKVKLSEIMNSSEGLMDNYVEYCREEGDVNGRLKRVVEEIGETRKLMAQVRLILCQLYECLQRLLEEINRVFDQEWHQMPQRQRKSYHEIAQDDSCEDILLINSRWCKLKKDFYDHDHFKYNISKIPDIYDTIRHDLRKNQAVFQKIDQGLVETLHKISRLLAHFVVINQYGIRAEEKLIVAKDVCLPLLDKILVDLMFWKEKASTDRPRKYNSHDQIDNQRHIRTRLYFTSASHMYSLFNILTLGHNRWLMDKTFPSQAEKIREILYLGYLSHIEFRLYENLEMAEDDAGRFRLEISLSPEYKKDGVNNEFKMGGKGLTIDEISDFFKNILQQNAHLTPMKNSEHDQ